MKKLPEIKWDYRNLKRKEWYLVLTLFLCSHLSMWLAIFNYGVIMGIIGTIIFVSSFVYLYFLGTRFIRVEVNAQLQVLFDTSVDGVKFRRMLSNATD